MPLDGHLDLVSCMVDFRDLKGYTAVVKFRVSIILFFLISTLLVQNTCPKGFAGKSTVTASCSHCPLKQTCKPVTEGNTFSSISYASAHLPMYVLDLPSTQPIFRLAAIASSQPVTPTTYKNTAPDELLRPPRA
jgi:hypothetical protein